MICILVINYLLEKWSSISSSDSDKWSGHMKYHMKLCYDVINKLTIGHIIFVQFGYPTSHILEVYFPIKLTIMIHHFYFDACPVHTPL